VDNEGTYTGLGNCFKNPRFKKTKNFQFKFYVFINLVAIFFIQVIFNFARQLSSLSRDPAKKF